MKIRSSLFSLSLSVAGVLCAAVSGAGAATTVTPDLNAMTSSFFQGTNKVRGYAGDNRPIFRVSTGGAFGLAGAETIYLSFTSFNPADYTAPVAGAILSVTSIDGLQGANASQESPFLVSAHGVSANPFTAITDDTNPGGTINWLDFYNNNILEADPLSRTSVSAFGNVDFDITPLVNSWIAGTNTNYVVALTGRNDTSGGDFLHGFANNTETPGSTRLTVVPEPGSVVFLSLAAGLLAGRRRSRKA